MFRNRTTRPVGRFAAGREAGGVDATYGAGDGVSPAAIVWVACLVALGAVMPGTTNQTVADSITRLALAETPSGAVVAGEDAGTKSEPDVDAGAGAEAGADADAEAAPPEEEKVAIAFKDVPLEKLCSFFGQKLGKPVIPHASVKGKKITIIHTRNEPLSIALRVIANALRQEGVIIQEYPRHIEFLPITELRKTRRPVVGPDESVADMDDKSKVVDKVFVVKHYDVARLKDVIVPMLPDYAYLMADPNIHTLIVTDTVANLERIESIVARLDVPTADVTVKRIFKIAHGDASDIVSIVRSLIAGGLGQEGKSMMAGGSGGKSGSASTVFIEGSKTPVLLMPEVTRNWIIAVAPGPIMNQIAEFVVQFDQPQQDDEPFEVLTVQYADMDEISQQIEQAVGAHPNEEIRNSLRVVPFRQSRKVFVLGSQRGRQFVTSLLEKLDLETSENTVMEEFVLEYADAERVADKIESLFSNRQVNYASRWGNSYTYRGDIPVKVTYDTYRNSVTVVTDPNRMERISKLVRDEWDVAADIEDVQPRVYLLKYADPLKVQDILERMYSETSRTSGPWWQQTVEQSTPVGRLHGQFSFESLEDSNVLIVTTKAAANYGVIDRLIEELDRPQEAGIPVTVELKHANAEDMAERLNAMFAERGTRAEVVRSKRELSSHETFTTNDNQNRNQQQQQQQNQQQSNPGMMPFWWSQGSQPRDERKVSNLIGQPRIVPIIRRNALLVMAPLAYQERLVEMIQELDRPGLQVVIHAIMVEVRHEDTTTLGMRFASDPGLLSEPRLQDNAVGGGLKLDFAEMFGSGRGTFEAGFDVSVLVSLLNKKFNLRVLNEPRIYTADNQEAEFFDGRDVPIQTGDQNTAEGTQNRSFGYREVGTRLIVRPHITNKGEVDLLIYVELSSVIGGTNVDLLNPVFDVRQTETHVVVEDGQTIMLSGIVRQDQFSEKRKVPFFGDIPLFGGLFKHTDTQEGNRELIIFITPRVVRATEDVEAVMEEERRLLDKLRGQLESDTETTGAQESTSADDGPGASDP